METPMVKIFLETAYKGPARRRMAGAWLMEYVMKTGKPYTSGGILYADITTENEMTLRLLNRTLFKLKKPCCTRVFTECQHVLNTMQNHWLVQWELADWKNARGKTVGNADLWQQAAALMKDHFMEWTDEEHSYRHCMIGQIQKEMERKHEMESPENYLEIAVPEWNTRVTR